MAVDQAFIIQSIMNKEALYAAFCVSTKMPFIICDPESFNDQVWVFDSEEALKSFVTEYGQKKYIVRGARMNPKQYAGFFGSLYTLGVNEVVVASADSQQKIALTDLVKRPDFSRIPAAARPVENPTLQLSGLYFMQEATRQVPNEEKKNLQELNEEFSADLAAARYIVAVIPKEGPGSIGEKIAKHEFNVPVLNMKNGKKFVPCFSDQFEFDKFKGKSRLLELAVPLPGLMQYSGKDTDGFMLNPMGMSMVLTRELIDAIQKAFPERVKIGVQKSAEAVHEAQEQAKKIRAAREAQAKKKQETAKKEEEKKDPIPVSHLPGHSKVLTPFQARKPEAAPAPVYRPVKKADDQQAEEKKPEDQK